jgi:para-nitrobenzyl esterase
MGPTPDPGSFGEDSALVVTTASGPVRGTREGASRAWKGIPYAAPPLGSLRFRAPQPPAAWSEVRDATAFGSGCVATSVDLQSGGNQVIGGDEDCLTLNVWAPSQPPAAPAPVLVFIHGGFYQQGSSADTFGDVPSYDGAYLTSHQPVVVVTINYRLGALGFLASAALAAADPDHRAGNYGLLDQIAALRWVSANIAAFGGDPARFLVFGQSAGGLSVCNLLASPLAAGLFSRALIESGGCYAYPRATALLVGARVVRAVGCQGAADVPACLRAVPAALVATAVAPYSWAYEFAPSVDPGVLEQPMAVLAAGRSNPVPVVIGTNANELGSMMSAYVDSPIRTDADYRAALAAEFGAALGDRVYARYRPASTAARGRPSSPRGATQTSPARRATWRGR